jgi:phosphatidate cytidylyltransferase
LQTVLIRIVYGVALGLPVLLIAWYGSPAFEAMVAVAVAVLAWEWFVMCGGGQAGIVGLTMGGFLVAAVGIAAEIGIWPAIATIGIGVAIIAVIERRGTWLSAGTLYLGVPCVALVWLRNDLSGGREIVLWLVAVVWAADIGGYVAGRLIGGRRLAPRISPNKTWAGLFGGVGLATATSVAVTLANGHDRLLLPAVIGGLLGIAAQAGDLAESWVKRRFGVKDSSALIPGHGGLLDRVDALMAVILVVAFIAAVDEGALSRWL